MTRVKTYYNLAKPGIIYGNAITALAGFFLAAKGQLHLTLLLATLIGLSLIIGAGCVFNNIIDSDIDGKMARTKTRAMVTGSLKKRAALLYGSTLFILGIVLLFFFSTPYALAAALTGFIVYVFVYTPLKRRTVYATLIGAIAGATPPVVGYAAVANRFDTGALILFLILIFWQMPHFYGIALYRLDDYASAHIPVWPLVKGVTATKIQMLVYIVAFSVAAASLTYFKFTGYIYITITLALSLAWLTLGIKGFKTKDYKLWGRKVFLCSLIVLTLLSVIISVDFIIH